MIGVNKQPTAGLLPEDLIRCRLEIHGLACRIGDHQVGGEGPPRIENAAHGHGKSCRFKHPAADEGDRHGVFRRRSRTGQEIAGDGDPMTVHAGAGDDSRLHEDQQPQAVLAFDAHDHGRVLAGIEPVPVLTVEEVPVGRRFRQGDGAGAAVGISNAADVMDEFGPGIEGDDVTDRPLCPRGDAAHFLDEDRIEGLETRQVPDGDAADILPVGVKKPVIESNAPRDPVAALAPDCHPALEWRSRRLDERKRLRHGTRISRWIVTNRHLLKIVP